MPLHLVQHAGEGVVLAVSAAAKRRMLLAACSVAGQVGDERHLWAVRRTPAENPVQGGWVRSARDWRGRARWQGQDAGGTPALPGDAVRLRGGGDVWWALVAGIVFQHVSMKSLLREMDRTPALLDVCGFDPLGPRSRPKREVVVGAGGPKVVLKEVPRGDGVPSAWNFSRFLSAVAALKAERGLIQGMAVRLREQLGEELKDFGEHPGYDGKAVESHSTGRKSGKTGKTSDPEAERGTLKYRCPAAAYGFHCAGRESCYREVGDVVELPE